MPRVIRDSDEEAAESKSSTRRTRATASSSTTDSPAAAARRTTRSKKQLAIIESSPESLDDSSPLPTVRKTRSRAATLDKSTAGIAKNLRSRKNSASSNLSETIDLDADQQQTTQKRVTRKAAAAAAGIGTPTKTSLRSRNLRAGSEAKSTPPTTSSRSTRVTRASSVDPINTPNESVVGTPVKRRTRASIVPVQQTVTEEKETENEISETLNNTVVEIDEDSENEPVSTKGKSSRKIAKNSSSSSSSSRSSKEAGKDTSTEQSNLDTTETIEGNMTDKSCTSNGAEVDETSEESTLKALGSHSISFKQESFTSRGGGDSESLVLSTDENFIKSNHPNKNDSVKSSVDVIDEYEHVDVENFTLTDDSIDVVNSPKKTDVRDTLALDIKDSYVKLDRTKLVEKIVGDKQQLLEEDKSNDLSVKITDVDEPTNQNDVIANAKTAIVLVNDFVKSNEYFNNMKDEKIFDSGISLNNREDVNSNASVHKSDDDDQLSIVTIEDNDEVLSLKLLSPNSQGKEADGDKLIIEALPDDEMNNGIENKVVMSVVNGNSIHNFEKSDFCLKDNVEGVLSESKSKLENVVSVNEKNIAMECVDEIGDESRLITENTGKADSSKMMNASVGINSFHGSFHQNDSIEDNPIVSANVKSPSIEIDLTEAAVEAKVEVGSGGNVIVEKNDSAVDSNSVEPERLVEVVDSSDEHQQQQQQQLEPMETSSSAMSESNLKENLEMSNSCNETSSNEIELKLEDKNGVPCAVTDADGENASWPVAPKDGGDEVQHETSADTTASKSPAERGGGGKRKSETRVTDSDLDESAENLFQDIPAEEWSATAAAEEQMKSIESKSARDLPAKLDSSDGSVVAAAEEESRDEREIKNQAKNNRKSLNGKERGDGGKSIGGARETENQEVDSPKKARKSLEKKRESGPSSDSGIQNGNKTVVESDSSDNELPNKSRSRRSLDGSLKAQSKNDSISEKLSKSLLADVPPKSCNTSRKSLNNSVQFNVSVFNTFRKKNDGLSELASNDNLEAMEVDEGSGSDSQGETSRAHDSQRRRKSHNKSLVGQSSNDDADGIPAKLSVSLNASSKVAKRSSLDKSLNRSSRKSLAAHDEQVAADSNKSVEQVTDDDKSPSPLKGSSALGKNDSLSGDVSLNESKKLRKRLSEKINVSARELPESEEMEVDVVTGGGDDKSPKKSRKSKSLNNSKSSFNRSEQASPKSGRKSANKSLNVSADDVITKPCENVEKVESTRRSKVTSKSPIKVPLNESTAEEEVDCRRREEGQETVPSVLDRSLQKSIERMKFSNPHKHDISTVVQVNTSSEDDSDDSQIPNFIFKLSDEEEETEDSSEENAENDVDSDVEREYNLGGKDIAKYSDDEVPGDDCRVSEEESSDNEDDGADLDDFVVPDEDDDDDEDEDEDEGEDEDEDEDNSDEDGDNDVEEEDEGVEIKGPSAKKVSALKKNVSINSSQSTVKNSSVQLRRSGFSQSSGSESDDEATEAESKISKEHFDYVADSEKILKESKKLEQQSIVLKNMIKSQNSSVQRKSVDTSLKSTRSNVSFNSSASGHAEDGKDQSRAKEKSVNISAKNTSLNTSKSGKDKSISKSNNDKNIATHNDSGKNKSVLLVENGHTESESSSDSDEYEGAATSEASEDENVASPSSETEETSEDGEDYYRIVTAESTKDASLVKPKSKKLIDCSTPKPGAAVAKKSDISRDNLSISAASRRKSGSLNDLTNTKMMSSRLSIGEAAASKSMKLGDTSMKLKEDVEIVATPETLTRPRQAWKLIPLNQTAHPAVEDTPGTKFLKKAKLNESFPVEFESMKNSSSNPPSAVSGGKKSKKAALKQDVLPPKERESTKKRKLLDVSHVHDEDSILKIAKKNKKRARLEESLMSAGNEEEQDAGDAGGAEEAQKSKKKKRNRAKEWEVEVEAPEEAEEKPSKKRKDKLLKAQGTDEIEAQSAEKPKKKKSKVSTELAGGQRSTKNRQKQADSDDEAPENVGFEEARRVALKEMQQQAEGIRTVKETLKKKRKDSAQKPTKSLKRLPEDILESLTDEPLCRPDKRQKLSRNRERSVMMPSKSMFSPGKSTPENLRVDDGYIPLSSAGGTTQFAVINMHKARKVAKKSAAVLNFRNKMLARNKRMPTSMYLDYLKRQKAKGNL